MRVIEKQLSEIDSAVSDYLRVNCSVQWGVIYAGAYSEHNGNKWEHDKWSFTLTRTGVKKGINFEYHTGIGHRTKKKNGRGTAEVVAVKPGPAGLFHSVTMSGDACNMSFAEWCSNFGYDTDSRKALQMYEACQQEYDKLRSMFTPAEIGHIMELLQDY